MLISKLIANEAILDEVLSDGNDSSCVKNQEYIDESFLNYISELDDSQKTQNCKSLARSFTLPLECGHIFLEGEYLYWKPHAVIPWAAFSKLFHHLNLPLVIIL